MSVVDEPRGDAALGVRRDLAPTLVVDVRHAERSHTARGAGGNAVEDEQLLLAVGTSLVALGQIGDQRLHPLGDLLRELRRGSGDEPIDVADGDGVRRTLSHARNLPDPLPGRPPRGHGAGRYVPATWTRYAGTMSTVSVAAPPVREADPTVAPVLVGPAWLQQHLGSVAVLDTRSLSEHREAHIAGAHAFPLGAFVVDDSREAALERLAVAAARALGNRGIAPTDHVVVYDDREESAALGALLCELAGVQRVSVLLGGLTAWRASGGEVTHEPVDAAAEHEAWAAATTQFAHVATFEQVAAASEHHDALLLDVRSQLEHEGIVGTPCCAVRGSIPSALHLEWTAFFDLSGAPRLGSDVRAALAQVGIERDDHVIVTCHTGRRAAAAALVLRASGLHDVRVSIGSWHEWCQRRAAACEVEDGQSAALAHAAH